jgi:hypothetical protein
VIVAQRFIAGSDAKGRVRPLTTIELIAFGFPIPPHSWEMVDRPWQDGLLWCLDFRVPRTRDTGLLSQYPSGTPRGTQIRLPVRLLVDTPPDRHAASQSLRRQFSQAAFDRVERGFGIRTLGRDQYLGAGADIGSHDVHDAYRGTTASVGFQGDGTLEAHRAANDLTGRTSVETGRVCDLHFAGQFFRGIGCGRHEAVGQTV